MAVKWGRAFVLSVLVVSGCAGSGGFCRSATNAQTPACRMTDAQQAAIPVKAEWWHSTLAITLRPLDTPEQQDGLRRAVGGHGGMALDGFAVPDPDSGRCDIYVSLPAQPPAFELEAVGHELLHCFVGGFHPDMMTGKAVSSYLSPRQATAQRAWLSGTIDEADKQSRWTLSCTFGVGHCPPPARPALTTLGLTLHPVDPEQLERIGRALGQNERPEGVAVPDPKAGRCDLYLPIPTTYLGHGMEVLGRKMLSCFAPGSTGDAEQRRRLVEGAMGAPASGPEIIDETGRGFAKP